MNRLWVRLTLAYALVILVVAGGIAGIAHWVTTDRLRHYVVNSAIMVPGSVVEALANHYDQHGGWGSAEALLAEGVSFRGPMTRMRAYGGKTLPGLDVVLADADGRVVFDTTGRSAGRRLSPRERAGSVPITDPDGGPVIGYLLVSVPRVGVLGPLEERFLERMRQLLLLWALIAVVLGLLVSVVINRSITASLRRLANATKAVAGGDLGHRVEVQGSVEVEDLARDFNEMISELEKAEKLRQNLVADVAHELRTPLSVLQGNLRAILDDVYPLEKSEIARLYDETRLLSRLVNDLRELAEAEAGQLSLNLRGTDIEDLVRSTVANFLPAAQTKGIQLNVQVADGLPTIEADPDRLAQVLRNLLINALRYTAEGGQIAVSAAVADDAVQIVVQDDGVGIAPEDLPHIFDRFWRVGRSRSRESGGSGLGLAIARSLVEAHGGHISVESAPGEGARFAIRLPIVR